MNRRNLSLWVLLPLLVASFACRAVTSQFDPPPTSATPVPVATNSIATDADPVETATAAPVLITPPTLTPVLPSATPSPLVPTSTFTPVPTWTSSAPPTIPVTPSDLQLSVFEELWQTVKDEYMYEDFNGVDWDAIYEEFRARVEAGLTDSDFYLAMKEMVFRLGDEHSNFLSPEEVAEDDAELAGEYDYVGIGVVTILNRNEDRAVVIAVFKDSPADQAGIKLHDSLIAVDGQAIVDENGDHRQSMRGPEGTVVQVTVQSPGEAPRQVSITRQRVQGGYPVPYAVLTTPEGKRIGYILVITFFDETIPGQVGEALKEMTADGQLDGLILDNRVNHGGISYVFTDVLSYFIDGLTGHYVNRAGERPLEVDGMDIGGSRRVPMVNLVGLETASFGEIFSGILKDFGRAYTIGETTPGNVEVLYVYEFDDGSRAHIAHDYFRPFNHQQESWEETGIIPDLAVKSDWELVTLETDPAVLAGLEYFDNLP